MRVDGFGHARGFAMPEPTLVDLDRNTALETARRERVSEVLDRVPGNACLLNVSVVARVGGSMARPACALSRRGVS